MKLCQGYVHAGADCGWTASYDKMPCFSENRGPTHFEGKSLVEIFDMDVSSLMATRVLHGTPFCWLVLSYVVFIV